MVVATLVVVVAGRRTKVVEVGDKDEVRIMRRVEDHEEVH